MPKTSFPDHDTLSPQEKLERFAMLRDTIAGLEAEKNALRDDIKAAMLDGNQPESELYRARLQTTQKISYSVDGFRDLYGDAAALEVAIIDPKRVKELLEAGDLDPDGLEAIVEVREQHALVLVAK